MDTIIFLAIMNGWDILHNGKQGTRQKGTRNFVECPKVTCSHEYHWVTSNF